MELRLLSNASLNPSVYWTTLLPPLFSGLARQPGVRIISPPPLAWARAGEWRKVRSELKGSDALFWTQLSARPAGPIHLASYLNLRARRSNYVLDAWRPSLTKIGLVATLERLNPCFVAYREAKDELERRFPMAKFVWLPFGAHTDIFHPRKEAEVDLRLLDGSPPRAVASGAAGVLRSARSQLRLLERRRIDDRGTWETDVQRAVLRRHSS